MGDQEPAGKSAEEDASAPNVLVVFEDREPAGWLRWLPRGFRHCFCLLRRPGGWLICDPLKGGVHLEQVAGYPIQALSEHFQAQGRTVLLGQLAMTGSRSHGPRPFTCVEFVKRVIGQPAWSVWTPHQLFRFLLRSPAARPNFRLAESTKLIDSDV
jgi:hypothetical protein